MNKDTKYTDLRPLWKKALFGSYLILPLKYDDTPNKAYINQTFKPFVLRTQDIGENVKDLINRQGSGNIGQAYRISGSVLEKELLGSTYERLSVRKDQHEGVFSFLDSYLYVFHTKVAFLCVGIRYQDLMTLYNICNPGYTKFRSVFLGHRADGIARHFSLERALGAFAEKCGLSNFFDDNSPAIVEAYVYTLALLPGRFPNIEVMRQATFNLHLMEDLNHPAEDESEHDLRYVYAVKDQELGSYSWGCCVSSQTISYVNGDPSMNLKQAMTVQARDGLPIVMIALYEKFTCLRFTELLRKSGERDKQKLEALKKMMLEFKAYGTVDPSNLSRWHNVKQIYGSLLSVNETANAIQDIDNKLKILAEQQQDAEQQKSDTVFGIISVFGVVSIVDSMLAIVQSLSGGQTLDYVTVGGTLASLAVVIAITLRKLKGK